MTAAKKTADESEPAGVVLGKFEGKKVLSVGIEIPSAGGGLNDALNVDPSIWHVGQEATIILRGPCTKIRHEPIKDTDGLRRVHIFGVEQATIVDNDFADDVLDEQARRIEAAAGVQQMLDKENQPTEAAAAQ